MLVCVVEVAIATNIAVNVLFLVTSGPALNNCSQCS